MWQPIAQYHKVVEENRLFYAQINERQDKSALALRPENLGVLAEYHVNTGIDDLALVTSLKRLGFQVLKHDRYTGGRYAFTHAALNRSGDATNFKLVLQKI